MKYKWLDLYKGADKEAAKLVNYLPVSIDGNFIVLACGEDEREKEVVKLEYADYIKCINILHSVNSVYYSKFRKEE